MGASAPTPVGATPLFSPHRRLKAEIRGNSKDNNIPLRTANMNSQDPLD